MALLVLVPSSTGEDIVPLGHVDCIHICRAFSKAVVQRHERSMLLRLTALTKTDEAHCFFRIDGMGLTEPGS